MADENSNKPCFAWGSKEANDALTSTPIPISTRADGATTPVRARQNQIATVMIKAAPKASSKTFFISIASEFPFFGVN
jgi:hypothetical protein